MVGAIIGDIVGRQFEGLEFKSKKFELFTDRCAPTDDSFMTLAVAKALLLTSRLGYSDDRLRSACVACMKEIANAHKNTLWGNKFYKWLFERSYPYESFGNGAAMRISPVGWVADSEEEVKRLSRAVTDISHNHPEGLKGGEAMAMAVYLARIGTPKEEIRRRMEEYYPRIKAMTINGVRPFYGYDEYGDYMSCQGSLPEALVAFFDGEDFEDTIRNALSIGGDADTLGAMAGAVAEAYYGVPDWMEEGALKYLSEDLLNVYYAFNTIKRARKNRNMQKEKGR